MESLKALFVNTFNFVTNPPVEVVQATVKLVGDTGECLTRNISTYAQTVLEAFKNIF